MKAFAYSDHGRDNNFNLIRAIAAGLVLVSHSWAIVNPSLEEPLVAQTGQSLGGISVLLFFATSGYFVSKSYDRKRSLSEFVAARCLRIFPALIVVLALTVAFYGPAFTALTNAAYATAPETLAYLPRNAMLIFGQQYHLPGVFEERPLNGSLWTLRWEAACYVMTGTLFAIGLARRRLHWIIPFTFIVIGVTAAYLEKGMGISQLFLAFSFGMAIYVYRDIIPHSGAILAALLVSTYLCFGSILFSTLLTASLSYLALWLGFCRIPLINNYNKLGDISYGLYVYAFPTQMALVNAFEVKDPITLAAAATPIVVVLATASWMLVEKPALALKSLIVKHERAKAA